MTRMWLPSTASYAVKQRQVTSTGERWEFISPGWIDVEQYPALESYCLTEHEYKLSLLMGQVPK